MDIRKGKMNVVVSIAFKIVTMVMVILVKRSLIQVCGNEVNGLNALYLSIIGFLSVAELGVGSAITFCIYKPIVEGDNDRVSALYHLFRRLYLGIGAIIFLSGVVVLPLLPYLAKDYCDLELDICLTYLLVLISVTLTYLFSAKTSLINAYKNNYITTTITQGGVVLQYVLQITALYTTRSFVWYLLCRIIAVLVQWATTEIIVRKKHGVILDTRTKLDDTTKLTVKKSIKAMFMHKVGYVLVNTVDSVIISAFVGVVSLGEYSNYTMIQSSMAGIITLIFSSLTSVLGHLYVEEGRDVARKYCEIFHLLNFIIGTVFYLGYYATIDNLIAILFSPELVVSKSISVVITFNGFVQFMRRGTLTFKDATGTFYSDRWKPLVEGVSNVVLSILLVNFLGVTGVIIATIITNLLVCHIIEPYVLYKNAFHSSPKRYYINNYSMIAVFGLAIYILDKCVVTMDNRLLEMLINGGLSLAFSVAVCLLIFLRDRSLFGRMAKTLKTDIRKS